MPSGAASVSLECNEGLLRVSGLTKLSTCDWPGRLVATVFCQGCGWRCGYCHNAGLQPFVAGSMPWAEVINFLGRRKGLLDAVVFTGGEATLQSALPRAMEEVRAMGFAVGLHTAGMAPERLEQVLGLVDWVGLDMKATAEKYAALTGSAESHAAWRKSLGMILAAGVACEVRTTVDRRMLDEADLMAMRAELLAAGVQEWALQACRVEGVMQALPVGEEFGRAFSRFTLRQ